MADCFTSLIVTIWRILTTLIKQCHFIHWHSMDSVGLPHYKISTYVSIIVAILLLKVARHVSYVDLGLQTCQRYSYISILHSEYRDPFQNSRYLPRSCTTDDIASAATVVWVLGIRVLIPRHCPFLAEISLHWMIAQTATKHLHLPIYSFSLQCSHQRNCVDVHIIIGLHEKVHVMAIAVKPTVTHNSL